MSTPGGCFVETLDELQTIARARGLRVVRVVLEPDAVLELRADLRRHELTPAVRAISAALDDGGLIGYWNGIELEAAK